MGDGHSSIKVPKETVDRRENLIIYELSLSIVPCIMTWLTGDPVPSTRHAGKLKPQKVFKVFPRFPPPPKMALVIGFMNGMLEQCVVSANELS